MTETRQTVKLTGTNCVSGEAAGEILATDLELSFWGGVDPAKGEVIDRHHPLSGARLKGKILALPGGRGSCSGSGVILEMLVNGQGPDAILTARPDDIIALGVLVAEEIFRKSIPLVILDPDDFRQVLSASHGRVLDGTVFLGDEPSEIRTVSDAEAEMPTLALTARDQALLTGAEGRARQVAMNIITRMARMIRATELMDVTQVHIDGCVYTGKASLTFAEALAEMGGRVAVPTTLNSISVDYRHWQAQGVDPEFAGQARALADAYTAMGAAPTYTCAPYLLPTAPAAGEQIAWAESNAVVYANSVLGARTMKYPDFLDACIALTGRAPKAGPHLAAGRQAGLHVRVDVPDGADDLLYPLLGYAIGRIAGDVIPAVEGLASLHPDTDALKAFGAAFATTASAPMFHIIGVTPEAPTLADVLRPDATEVVHRITRADLREHWSGLCGVKGGRVDLVSLGNPHFSLSEFGKLAALCRGRARHRDTAMTITAARDIVQRAEDAGYFQTIRDFGATIVTDTCWCMIAEPVIPPKAGVILSNSAKYAHYGPGMTGRDYAIASMEDCVTAAETGMLPAGPPDWL